MAPVWEVQHSAKGVICNLVQKKPYVNHYSFHIMDPDWGHLPIKMSGHPPFGAQIILNGHEWVACQASKAGVDFTKEGNCFTRIADAQALAGIADTLSEAQTVGRLTKVCDVGSTQPVSASPSTPRSSSAAASSTPTRSTRPSRAATCSFEWAGRWTRSSGAWWTAPAPD